LRAMLTLLIPDNKVCQGNTVTDMTALRNGGVFCIS
jgi:hypothetical protein